MQKSESITELAKALSSFQGSMTAVKKDAVNPFYKSKYASLDIIWEAIRKPLLENGLSVTQTGGWVLEPLLSFLETTLFHSSGEWIQGTMLVKPVKDDPQSLGSAISYARRYSLSAILGLVADEDDDAESATPKEKSTPTAVRDTAKKTTPNKFPVKWLKGSMSKLQEAGENSWSKENVLSYLKTTYNITGETITEVVGKLTDSQSKAFIAEVNSSLKGIEEH